MQVSGRERSRLKEGLPCPDRETGKGGAVNRVAIVAVSVCSLLAGSSIDPEKLQYFIAGALFTLAMEALVRIITWLARKASRPQVHSV